MLISNSKQSCGNYFFFFFLLSGEGTLAHLFQVEGKASGSLLSKLPSNCPGKTTTTTIFKPRFAIIIIITKLTNYWDKEIGKPLCILNLKSNLPQYFKELACQLVDLKLQKENFTFNETTQLAS